MGLQFDGATLQLLIPITPHFYNIMGMTLFFRAPWRVDICVFNEEAVVVRVNLSQRIQLLMHMEGLTQVMWVMQHKIGV